MAELTRSGSMPARVAPLSRRGADPVDSCRVAGALLTAADPTYADPSQSLRHRPLEFGTDPQGHDIYLRTVYGARVTVGLATPAVYLVGRRRRMGGFYGSWIDVVVSHHRCSRLAVVGRHRALIKSCITTVTPL